MNPFNRPSGFGLRLVTAGLVLFCGLLGLSQVAAEQVKDLPAKPADYVSDFAHVLSPGAISRIDNLCTRLDRQANAQIAIVTVKTLDGDDPADWANALENKWHMGKKGSSDKSNKGVLMLLSVNDHKWRIDVGYGLEGILNDAKLGDIGRAMRPQLRARDYDAAILSAVSSVGNVIAQDAKITLDDWPADAAPPAPQRPHYAHRSHPLAGFILLIILLVIFGGSWIFRLLFGLALFSGPRRGGWGGGGFGGGGFGGFGGGGGGGDSGGGFGGFGGGDFGGGGAGGDW
jgi:uncharacterized protein